MDDMTPQEKIKAYEEAIEEIRGMTEWLLGEKGDFPNLSQKPHYSFRTELRSKRDSILTKLDEKLKGV